MINIVGKGYGQETETELKEIYNRYNKELFNNELPTNTVIKWNNRTTRTIGSQIETESGHIIELSKKYHTVNDHKEISNTLIHEMIHVKYPDNGHGNKFQEEAKRINKVTGLNIRATGSEPNAKMYYRYKYKCLGCGQEGQANTKVDNQYLCGQCGGELQTINDKEV